VERLFEVFEKSADGAFVIDHQQNIIFWSQSAEEILGYSAQEAHGRKCYDLLKGCSFRGENICRAQGLIISTIQQQQPVRHFDLLVQHREGPKVPIGVSTLPFYDLDDDTQPAGLTHIFYALEEPKPVAQDGLRIRLLGPIAVKLSDGSLVDGPSWQRLKVRALLIYLLLQRGHPVSREKLVDTLWPDLDYESALRNLNTTVYNLRRSLEPELARGSDSRYVIYESGSYLLATTPDDWLDVNAFDTGVRTARLQPDTVLAIGLYEEALSLYRGDYLEGLEMTGAFCYGEQQRLRERYLSALEELGGLYEVQGLDARAKNRYLRSLAVDPCRETAVQKLMRLYLRLGDRPSAAQTCRKLVACLETEYDMRPSRETQLLCKLAHCDDQLEPSTD
jgi:PAS domain S-box-containing protein